MSFIISHDIPLSRQTVDAWKSQGGVVLKRHRSASFIQDYVRRHEEVEFALNLGSALSRDTIGEKLVINPNNVVSPLWTPWDTRGLLWDALPDMPSQGHTDWWSKTTGRAGRGKVRHSTPFDRCPNENIGVDYQEHIEGQEYRILTVGEKIVQQMRRHGPNGDRRYEWIERGEIPNTIKDVVARATRNLGTYTLIAWDTIDAGNRAFVFEGNCCPGVKEPTAARIVTAVRRLINA